MRQILQNLKTGETELATIPTPKVRPGCVLIKSSISVLSVGTERMLVDFGKGNMISKARQQPDKVRQVLDKVKTDGLQPTINAVRTKLDQPLPLGYSNAGIVIDVGAGVEEFQVGDRVISNGNHAEVVCVPHNLCAKIPENVDFESASFTVISSIGLQGIRLAQPTLGENFVVMGLGLIGLITVQLLRAHGCRVLATDFDQKKLELAKSFGADVLDLNSGIDPVEYGMKFSNGNGVDGVIITASTKSNEPVSQAAKMSRKRGRIILVGVTGLELSRADFYEKELTFQVSCSYGPGRYDDIYENKGIDYPYGFVRWTEKRNFEAILEMMDDEKLNIKPLISKVYPIDKAVEAYQRLSDDRSAIGILLKYNNDNNIEFDSTVKLTNYKNPIKEKSISLGVIGAGNFTNQILLPAINKETVNLKSIVSSGGVNGVHVGKRFGFEETTTDAETVLNNLDINSIIITTRHNSHANYVKKSLEANKHVFVEKPLCLYRNELDEIKKIKENVNRQLMVGFNRRFAPLTIKMKELLGTTTKPKTFVMLVNAGEIPANHWTQDPNVGGGRIIGEACHFIDLLRFLSGTSITSIHATKISDSTDVSEDKATITLTFADGSVGTIHYFANGHKSYPKEKLDVFVGGKILSLNNFKVLEGYGWSNFRKLKLKNQDKGHKTCINSFFDSIKNGYELIPVEEIFEVTEATFDAMDQLR